MYDSLLREDPWVREYGDEREAQGEARGEAQGEAKGIRRGIKLTVQGRFPGLADLAMERVERIQDIETLEKVQVALSAVQDESKARHYLLAL